MKIIKIALLVVSFIAVYNNVQAKTDKTLKPRLVVMTDIGDCDVEPDDMESAVRLMAYADMFEIEAIMTTVGWNCDPYPEEWTKYLTMVVDAYGKDVNNLMRRSRQKSFMPIAKEDGKQNALIQVDSKTKKMRYTPEYFAYKHFSHFISKGTEMVSYAGRDYSKTPVNVFRKGNCYIVTAGNFTDTATTYSVKLDKKYLNITLLPHSFNTYITK